MIMYNLLSTIRAKINRTLRPPGRYYLINRSLKPLSTKFGFDRGKPIDRYWIEKFLSDNTKYIKGRVLEITDNKYTKKFGKGKVDYSDILDINVKNKKANIIGDLRNLKNKIESDTYDCIILTHVLGLIDEYQSVISECRRILKPNGVLLYTGSCLGPVLGEKVYWRFTPNSVKLIFKKYLKPKKLVIKSYGNVLVGQSFWVGMSQEDLTLKELEYNDKRFPCIVTAVAKI